MIRVFGDSTDQVWRDFGKDDPYFGVLSHAEYSRENLTSASVEAFFKSGETHIAQLLSSIERAAIPLRIGRALDFGCGVGRLLIPLATRFREAIGVDVSEGMLAECKRNLDDRKLINVMLSERIPHLDLDVVHSALVFQHINARRGYDIILECWSRLAPGGLLAIQLPTRFTGSRATWHLRQLRNALPILQAPYNILSNRRWNKPGVQMNVYDLNVLSARLLDAGATRIILLRHDSDSSFVGVYVLAVKA
jgi:trans-aconitate methyltransferase